MPYAPFCTSYAALQVTGSTYPDVDGIYYAVAAGGAANKDVWCKNDVNDLIRIINASGSVWAISYRMGIGPSNAPLFFATSDATCPPLGEYAVGAFGSGPAPTVSEYIPAINPIDARNAKYATATEAGSARFRRLFALGYV